MEADKNSMLEIGATLEQANENISWVVITEFSFVICCCDSKLQEDLDKENCKVVELSDKLLR